MDWPFGVVKFVRPQTPPIVELLVIYDLKTTSQSVLKIVSQKDIGPTMLYIPYISGEDDLLLASVK